MCSLKSWNFCSKFEYHFLLQWVLVGCVMLVHFRCLHITLWGGHMTQSSWELSRSCLHDWNIPDWTSSLCFRTSRDASRSVALVKLSQLMSNSASAMDVYVLALCSLQQQGICHSYGILKWLACIHKETDNKFKCDYNHRSLSFNSKFIGNKATSVITNYQCVNTCCIASVNSFTTHKCIIVLHYVVGDATSVNYYKQTQCQVKYYK
jgi:hypothetical protein